MQFEEKGGWWWKTVITFWLRKKCYSWISRNCVEDNFVVEQCLSILCYYYFLGKASFSMFIVHFQLKYLRKMKVGCLLILPIQTEFDCCDLPDIVTKPVFSFSNQYYHFWTQNYSRLEYQKNQATINKFLLYLKCVIFIF